MKDWIDSFRFLDRLIQFSLTVSETLLGKRELFFWVCVSESSTVTLQLWNIEMIIEVYLIAIRNYWFYVTDWFLNYRLYPTQIISPWFSFSFLVWEWRAVFSEVWDFLQSVYLIIFASLLLMPLLHYLKSLIILFLFKCPNRSILTIYIRHFISGICNFCRIIDSQRSWAIRYNWSISFT